MNACSPCVRLSAVLLALGALAADAVPLDDADAGDDVRPQDLRSLGASGRALVRVAERIDRTHALGDCAAPDSGPRVKAVLDNVRSGRGRVRLSLFGRDPGQWVRAKGGKLLRFDVPATHGHMEVCMPLPDGPGVYALALYHDENADGKYSLASEGYGFSNNARAGLFGPPAHREAAFVASGAITEVPIRLRY